MRVAMLAQRKSLAKSIVAAGRAQDMCTLREDSERWLASGLTSLEEVIRVTVGA